MAEITPTKGHALRQLLEMALWGTGTWLMKAPITETSSKTPGILEQLLTPRSDAHHPSQLAPVLYLKESTFAKPPLTQHFPRSLFVG